MMTLALLVLQVREELVAENLQMDAFAWIFMLVSMGAVTILTIWSFSRILRGKQHFDPDGTGPASPPVKGRVEQ